MKIIRGKYLELIPENSFENATIKQILKAECERDNPLYIKAQKSNRFVKGLTRKVQTYKEIKDKFLVYKANKKVFDLIIEKRIPFTVEDRRITSKCDIDLKFGPRDEEQGIAINKLFNEMTQGFGYCCLSAPPAAGKTYMAVNLMSKLSQKTLIIVDMRLLIDQFIESITRFSDIKESEIGLISDGKVDIDNKKVIIATAQTLIKKKELYPRLEKEIGFVIVDEVHVASSNTFQELIPQFRPMYQLGLSGSHNRDDKMEFLIHEAVGPIAAEIGRAELVAAGSIVTPVLRPIFLQDDEKFDKFNNDNVDFREVVENYYNCPKTILKISKFIVHYYNQNRSQLLICKEKTMIEAYHEQILRILLGEEFINKCNKEIEDSISIIKNEMIEIENTKLESNITKKELKDLEAGKVSRKSLADKYEVKKMKKIELKSKELARVMKKTWKDTEMAKNDNVFNSVVIITGEVSATLREQIINDANSGKIKILITSTVLDKAVSINRLDTLHLLFSTRERANCIQRIGRISRSSKNKTDAVVFDYIYDHYMSFYQFNNNAGECRMAVHNEYTLVNKTNDCFIKFLKNRYNQGFRLTQRDIDNFEAVKNKYIMKIS
ncbi:MAG: DEAD/DEAH box helicase [Peptostreptococcaceae bacterium]